MGAIIMHTADHMKFKSFGLLLPEYSLFPMGLRCTVKAYIHSIIIYYTPIYPRILLPVPKSDDITAKTGQKSVKNSLYMETSGLVLVLVL